MMAEEESLALRRGRRSRGAAAKEERSKKLQQIKAARKHGFVPEVEIEEKADIFQYVDEREFLDRKRKRQEENFVVNDYGTGYTDTGNEIFEEEEEEEEEQRGGASVSARSKKSQKAKKLNSSVISMFRANAKRPKREEKVSLGEDAALNDLLEEVQAAPLHTPSRKRPRDTGTPFRSNISLRPKQMTMSEPLPSPNFESPSVQVKQRPIAAKKETSYRSVPVKTTEPAVKTEVENMDVDITDDLGDFPENNDDGVDDIEMLSQAVDMEDEETKENGVPSVHVKEEAEATALVVQHRAVNTNIIERVVSEVAWETIREEVAAAATGAEVEAVSVDTSKLPMTEIDGEQVFRFFWLDAYEEPREKPGTVHLFGKIAHCDNKTGKQVHVSCCVHVNGIERRMFVLPRTKKLGRDDLPTDEDVTMMDVYQEINELTSKYKIMRFISKSVERRYCFDLPDVPAHSNYLEVKYSFAYPAFPADVSGRTFSRVFGTNTSCLELFLLQQKLKGPSWLDVRKVNIPHTPSSWCKVEVFVESPDSVSIAHADLAPPPPVVVLSTRMQTIINPKSHSHEIMAICCRIHYNIPLDKPVKIAEKTHLDMAAYCKSNAKHVPADDYFCVICPPTGQKFPDDFMKEVDKKVERTPSERGLLSYFLAKVASIDPDVIVGHDILSFDLDVILHRLGHHKVSFWSKLSRLQRREIPRRSGGGRGGFVERSATAGRLVCDIKISCKELIHSCRSYDLQALSTELLDVKFKPLTAEDVPQCYINKGSLWALLNQTLGEASYALFLMYNLNALPLALQITRLAGNVMARTLQGGRSERNEFLLLHAFTEKDYICPDKQYGKRPVQMGEDEDEMAQPGISQRHEKQGRKKPTYSGGLVLDPKKGFYDKMVLLLDFNSLYPTLIREYNICFTTIETKRSPDTADDNIPPVPESGLDPGVLPTQITILVERRREVKKEMKIATPGSDLHAQLDVRQKALKLTANSMYGCLGFSHSRFYAKPLAALVTFKGRETLARTKDVVEKMGLEVIYGDTDSIMIKTNTTDREEVLKLGNKVKAEINKCYNCLQIDIDGIFRSLLLLKKKKYAAMAERQLPDGSWVQKREDKGLDIVRRDWCMLAKNAGSKILEIIFEAKSTDALLDEVTTYLEQVRENVDKYPQEQFEITKSLTKRPHEYADSKSLPHVMVALRMANKRRFGPNDIIPYIICDDGSSSTSHTMRAFHPDEVQKKEDLKIDYKYYLQHQVHPVVSRLCDTIEMLDAAILAERLGLDPSEYRRTTAAAEEEEADMSLGWQVDDDEKFKNVDLLTVTCASCKEKVVLEGLLSRSTVPGSSILNCTKCNKQLKRAAISNRLLLDIREHVRLYYEGSLMCEDAVCGLHTRQIPIAMSHQQQPACPQCRHSLKAIYTEGMLYNQLLYYKKLFDVEQFSQGKKKASLEFLQPGLRSDLDHLHSTVLHHLHQSGYGFINLDSVFSMLAVH